MSSEAHSVSMGREPLSGATVCSANACYRRYRPFSPPALAALADRHKAKYGQASTIDGTRQPNCRSKASDPPDNPILGSLHRPAQPRLWHRSAFLVANRRLAIYIIPSIMSDKTPVLTENGTPTLQITRPDLTRPLRSSCAASGYLLTSHKGRRNGLLLWRSAYGPEDDAAHPW